MNKKIKPNKNQLEFLNWELGVFFHFGIRTFYEGYKDWDLKPMELSAFNPTELDCTQWIRSIKEAGARYAVFVAKHHDGFANWPSKYTDYSVANTPWKQGNGDVVGEFVSACRKYDMKVGIYYSPADYQQKNRSGDEHDEYFINQISELLTGYGTVDYLWFDGCGSEDHQYDTVRIVKEIRRMQPNILIFNMWDPDTRWVGNEAGIAPFPCFNEVDSLDFSIQTTKKDKLDKKIFLPAECDCRMRSENWFFSENDEHTVKSLDELIGLYYYSVGRGANLLINIGPDRSGKLPEKDIKHLSALGNEIKRRFANPIFDINNFTHEKDTFTLKLDSPKLINHIVICEDLTDGESVLEFRILVKPFPYGENIVVYEGKNIGHKAICEFKTIYANEVVVEILKTVDAYRLEKLNVYYVD